MKYSTCLISFFLAILVSLGFLVLSAEHVRAQAPGCGVTIGKIASPADDTPFDFLTTGVGPAEFTLMDPSDPSTMFTMGGGTNVTITEQAPAGWVLEDIACSETNDQIIVEISQNDLSISCITGPEEVTCNFINRRITASPIPTLSEWGLIAMAGILGIAGFMVIRRRKVAA
jgi:hypothetical protein